MNYEQEEMKDITLNYQNYVSNLNDKELLSLAYDHEIRMEDNYGEVTFYIESIFIQESRLNSTSIATMVDIGSSTNALLKQAWFETQACGFVSVFNQYIIVNCVRQMLESIPNSIFRNDIKVF